MERGIYDINPPNWTFSVGDKVILGGLTDPVVKSISEDGKYIEIEYSNIDRKGNFIKRESRKWEWFEVYPLSNNTESPLVDAHNINYSSRMLGGLITAINREEYNYNPDYQRSYVWTNKDKLEYIDSIFEGRDLGKFIVIEYPYNEDDNRYVVLDGKQRMNAIKDFTQGKIQLYNYYWHELLPSDRWHIENKVIQYAQLDGGRLTKLQILKIFYNVNFGGVPQTSEHLAEIRKMISKEEGKQII